MNWGHEKKFWKRFLQTFFRRYPVRKGSIQKYAGAQHRLGVWGWSHKKILNSSKFWMDYKCRIQNWPYLKKLNFAQKNPQELKNPFQNIAHLFSVFIAKPIKKNSHFWTIISQNIKIGKLIFISLRTLHNNLDIKMETAFFEGGGRMVCISLTINNPQNILIKFRIKIIIFSDFDDILFAYVSGDSKKKIREEKFWEKKN